MIKNIYIEEKDYNHDSANQEDTLRDCLLIFFFFPQNRAKLLHLWHKQFTEEKYRILETLNILTDAAINLKYTTFCIYKSRKLRNTGWLINGLALKHGTLH